MIIIVYNILNNMAIFPKWLDKKRVINSNQILVLLKLIHKSMFSPPNYNIS